VIVLLAARTPDREAVAAFLVERGYQLSVMEPSAAQPAKLGRGPIDAIVVDLASSDALKFLRRYAAYPVRAPIVCLADRRRPDASSDALKLGAMDIVARPLRFEELIASLGNAREYLHPPESLAVVEPAPDVAPDAAFGVSPAMRDVLGLVRRVAPSRCAVLIVGERGTGREMVARAIHDHGSSTRPFIKFTCDAVPVDFAPTLQRAGDATVYLEDAGALPLGTQARIADMVRALRRDRDAARREPRIVGGVEPGFFELVARGLVRRDFADALSVVRIDLPPLRQRPQDVPLLAMHFLKLACRDHDAPPKTFSGSALMLLAALPWHGNVAELRSLCERLALVVPRGVVWLEDVLGSVRFDGADAIGPTSATLREARERFERDYLTAALQHHRGRMGAAARQLGIERTNLYRKMKQLKVRRPGPRG
jgi:two-component system nitrogen regulation response regulator NtrX